MNLMVARARRLPRSSSRYGLGLPARLARRGKTLLKRADAAVQVADQRILTRLTADQQRHLKQLLHAAGTHAAEHAEASRNP
jgi:hypothetical protein